jgi:hypothetical protein
MVPFPSVPKEENSSTPANNTNQALVHTITLSLTNLVSLSSTSIKPPKNHYLIKYLIILDLAITKAKAFPKESAIQ